MKSNKIIIVMLLLLLASFSYGVIPIRMSNMRTTRQLHDLLRDRIGTLDDEVAALEAASVGGVYDNIGTGDVFYVDSATGSDGDTGVTWALAKATLDAAVALCADGNNDIIYIASAHTETLTADITLDIDGLTVIGIGTGTDKPVFVLDTTTDEIIVDAAGVTLYNVDILAGATGIVTGINVKDEGVDFHLIGCSFPEPAAATSEFTCAIQLTTGSSRVVIAYNDFTNIGATAELVYFLDFGAAAIDGVAIVGNNITADASGALINSNMADTNLLIANNVFDQRDADKLAVQFTSTATGHMIDNLFCQLGDVAYILDPGSLHLSGNMASTAIDSPSFPFPVEPAEGRYTGTGKVFYVDASGSGGDGETWATAVITLDDAFDSGYCVANRGDTVYVAAGHTEEFAAADAADIDIAGVTVIGLGNGSDRPMFDYITNANGELVIGAAGVTIKNLTFKPNVNIVAHAIQVDTAGDYFTAIDCEFLDGETAGTDEFVDCIEIDTDAHNITIKNCKYTCTGANANTFVDLTDTTPARVSIIGCEIYGLFLEAPIYWGAAVPTQLYIADNTITNTDADQFCIEGSGNATGTCVRNTLKAGDLDTCLDPGYMACIENYASEYVAGGTDQPSVLIPLAKKELGISGNIWYVDDGGTDAVTHGRSWQQPFDTIAYACTAATSDQGDVIYVQAGHTTTLAAAATIALDDAGVTIIGIGEGTNRPTIVFSATASTIDVTAANVTIKNLILSSTTAPSTLCIDVDAADFTIEDCTFKDTGNHDFIDTIDLGTGADRAVIRNCIFTTGGASTGAASCITATGGAVDDLIIEDCFIFGDFTVAAIESSTDNLRGLIKNNVINNQQAGAHCIELTGSATGTIVGNVMYGDTAGSIIDPGTMLCVENYSSTASDASAYLDPGPLAPVDIAGNLLGVDDAANLGVTTSVTEDIDGSVLERLEHLKIISDDILAALHVSGIGIGDVYYVDDIGGHDTTGDGTTWELAEKTLNAAYDDATTNTGSVIFLAPNHTEDLADGASLIMDKINIKMIGIGVGESRPTITFSATGSSVPVTTADNMFKNIIFSSITADSTVGFALAAGADNMVFEDCEFKSTGAFEFVDVMTMASGTDDLTIKNCRFNNATGGTNAVSAITNTTGVCDGMVIEDTEFYGAWTTAPLEISQADTDVVIRRNIVQNTDAGEFAVEFTGNILGTFADNYLYTTGFATMADIGYMKCYNNLQAIIAGSGGIDFPLLPGKTYTICKTDGGYLTGDDQLFDITGGPIEVLSVTGLVTVICGGACTLTLNATDAETTTQTAISTAVACDSDPAGDTYTFTVAATPVLTPVTAGVQSGPRTGIFFIPAGEIEVNGSAARTGNIEWYLTFRVMKAGTVVAPAA